MRKWYGEGGGALRYFGVQDLQKKKWHNKIRVILKQLRKKGQGRKIR